MRKTSQNWDYEIYKYALCQFDECIEDMGINFKKGVNSFKIVNKYLMHLLTIKSQFNYYFKKIYNYN